MSLLFFLTLINFATVSFGQEKITIDTSSLAYRSSTQDYYRNQTIKTEKYIASIADKKLRKKYGEIYAEKKSDFLSLNNKGFFIYDEKYSQLIETVFQNIKKNNPNENLEDIKILLALSEEINACNIGENIVILNLPLLLNIDNEYQLAYIISHEIAHQKLDHVNKSILKRLQLNNSEQIKSKVAEIERQKYNKGKAASLFLKSLVYSNRSESRQKEHEADSLGYIYFSKAYPNYRHQALQTLKKLKEIDRVNDSLVKQDYFKIFDKPVNGFKEEWLTNEALKGYSYQKYSKFWEIDSLRTHPDCDERVSFLVNKFKITGEPEQVDLKKYRDIKKEAEKESILNLFFIEEYGKSLYFTLIALKKTENDPFLRKMMYENLIKISDSRNTYTLNKYLETENPTFTDSYNQYLSFIRNIRKKELNQIIDYFKP